MPNIQLVFSPLIFLCTFWWFFFFIKLKWKRKPKVIDETFGVLKFDFNWRLKKWMLQRGIEFNKAAKMWSALFTKSTKLKSMLERYPFWNFLADCMHCFASFANSLSLVCYLICGSPPPHASDDFTPSVLLLTSPTALPSSRIYP